MAVDTSAPRLGQSGLELIAQQEKWQSEVSNAYIQESNSTVPKASSIISNPNQAENRSPHTKDYLSDKHANFNSQRHVSNRPSNSSNTKYCYRHRPDSMCRRKADEYTMEFLRSNLEKLPSSDQESISQVWSLFSAAPARHRNLMLQGIIAQCCFPQLSYLSTTVRDLIRIDFLSALPCEISIRILCFLDTTSLCKSAQVSRKWRKMADDDVVWHRMCEQHIDRKCTQCGWGLPLLERNMLRNWKHQQHLCASDSADNKKLLIISPTTEEKLVSPTLHKKTSSKRSAADPLPDETDKQPDPKKRQLDQLSRQKLRPWKCVYKDRFQIGSNWKYGRCSTKIFRGHSNGVMCLQFEDNILATGSYDLTIKIWDVDSEKCIRTLRGHTSGIRALQFDNQKLISGSLDKTIRVWNWRTGECINAYMAHTAGVIALHFVGNILASGSMDNTVKVWNFEDKSVFILQGHTDWVNAVRVDLSSRTLFSASDDRTVRLWDLDTHQLIQVFEGHVGQVQQVILLSDEHGFHDISTADVNAGSRSTGTISEVDCGVSSQMANFHTTWPAKRPKPPQYMLSGALDSTVRLWDVTTGRCLKTLFGHEEGIWALAGDRLRVVTGAEDRMVKVWDIQTGKCEKTFSGHTGPVTCIGLSDSRMCSGSEDCEVRLYSFKHEEVTTKNTYPDSGVPD